MNENKNCILNCAIFVRFLLSHLKIVNSYLRILKCLFFYMELHLIISDLSIEQIIGLFVFVKTVFTLRRD